MWHEDALSAEPFGDLSGGVLGLLCFSFLECWKSGVDFWKSGVDFYG